MPKINRQKYMTEKQRPNLILLPLFPLAGMAWILNKLGHSIYLVNRFAGFMNSPKQKRKAFAGYEPAGTDVIVATYAKSGTKKYIVVVRDPKEVFVSGYYFAQSMFGSMLTAPVMGQAQCCPLR